MEGCANAASKPAPSMTLSALSRDTSGWRAAGSSFWFLLTRAFAVSFIWTKVRCLNRAVESASTSHPCGHRGTDHDSLFRRRDRAREQRHPFSLTMNLRPPAWPSGLPCLRTSSRQAASLRRIEYTRAANLRAMATLATACPLRNLILPQLRIFAHRRIQGFDRQPTHHGIALCADGCQSPREPIPIAGEPELKNEANHCKQSRATHSNRRFFHRLVAPANRSAPRQRRPRRDSRRSRSS
jgi:hypothetical protein